VLDVLLVLVELLALLLVLVEVLVLPAPEVVLEVLLDELLVLPLVDPLVLVLEAPPAPLLDEPLVLGEPPPPWAVVSPRSQPADTRPSVASHSASATRRRGFRIMRHSPASRGPARIFSTMLASRARSKSKDRRSNLVTFPMPLN
jgi:hypothetical protein